MSIRKVDVIKLVGVIKLNNKEIVRHCILLYKVVVKQ